MHCGDQRHLGLCLGYVPALAYGSCRVSDQGTTLRASDLHNARATILNPFNNMNYLVLIHYEAEIYRRSSEAGGGESCIVENLCMVLYVTCIATPLWRHNDSSVTKSTQNMNANIDKLGIIWIVRFVNCASIYFDEIYFNSNKNSGSIL